MKRKQTLIVALEEAQWEWAYYPDVERRGEASRTGFVSDQENEATPPATALSERRDALLAQWRAQRVPFQSARLILGMPASDALVRIMDLPTSEPEELREMSALQIEKISPFTPEQTAVGYEVINSTDDASRVLAAGLDADRIGKMGALFREIGLKPERVDLNLCARWSVLAASAETAGASAERVAHLLVRDDACDLIAIQAGSPILLRALARRDQLTDAAFAAEISEQTAYSLAACDVEHGPVANSAIRVWHAGVQPPTHLLAALRAVGCNEVTTDSTDAWPGLCEALAQRGSVEAARRMNLAPAAWRLAEIDQSRRRRLLLTLGAAATLWLIAVGGLHGMLRVERLRLTGIDHQYEGLSNRYERVRALSNRVQNLTQYTDQSESALETLREISARQPRGIDLSSFDYRKGLLIRLAGEAQNAAQIYEFKNALDASALFAGTDPPSIARSARGDRETFRMSINFQRGAVGSESGP